VSKYYVGLFLIFIYIHILSCYYHCEIKLRWLLWNRHKLLSWISFGACWLSEAPSTHVATYILTQDPPVVGTNHSPTYGYGFWPDRVWKPNGGEHSMLTITRDDFHSTNSLMQFYWETLSWFRANMLLLSFHNAACLAKKQHIPILQFLVLTRWRVELTIYHIWNNHANHYTVTE
jgi:hypothetical protein